eukprot:scpid93483/ scgid14914/ 
MERILRRCENCQEQNRAYQTVEKKFAEEQVHVHAGPAVDVSAEATVDVDAGAANDGALEPAPGIAGLDPVCGTRRNLPCVIQALVWLFQAVFLLKLSLINTHRWLTSMYNTQ